MLRLSKVKRALTDKEKLWLLRCGVEFRPASEMPTEESVADHAM